MEFQGLQRIQHISPLGNRWGYNGNQLHHSIPDYSNDKITAEMQRQSEAIIASEVFAREMAKDPSLFQDDNNGNDDGKVIT